MLLPGTGVPQIAAPRSIPAPAFATTSERESIYDFDDNDKRVEAPRRAVEHFIDVCWPVPWRDNEKTGDRNWRMSDDDYRAAAALLCAIKGAPLQKKGRSYAWRDGVTQESLMYWYRGVTRYKRAAQPSPAVEIEED